MQTLLAKCDNQDTLKVVNTHISAVLCAKSDEKLQENDSGSQKQAPTKQEQWQTDQIFLH